MLTLTDSPALAEALMAAGRYKERMDCRQAFYLKKDPPAVALRPGVTLRPLTMEDLPFVLENYHNPGAYESHIRGRIAEGMVAGQVDGQLAGFAGVHQEGALGMLEVVPAFRRRGLAGGAGRRRSSAGCWKRAAFPTAMCGRATPPRSPSRKSWGWCLTKGAPSAGWNEGKSA